MSETVHYQGTLTKVERLEGESLEQQCKRLLAERLSSEIELGEGASWREYFEDETYKEYVIHDEVIYKADIVEMDDNDVFKANRNSDGTIGFTLVYYNGGCSFNEAIEIALKALD